EALLREAQPVTARARDDETAADVAIAFVWVVGVTLARPEEAAVLVPAAEAAVARAGDPPRQRSDLDHTIGTLQLGRDRCAEAVSVCERAMRAQAEHGLPDPARAQTLLALAQAQRGLGKLDEAEAAERQALALAERSLGPGHPNVGLAYSGLGLTLLRR